MDPTETDIALLAMTHKAPLGGDNIPDKNQAHYCFSCQTPFQGLYCTSCGQKNDDFRRSIFSLVKEFISSITAIESRIWRTWAGIILKPGKVPREFADGRRTLWSSPVRVYLAMSIILFGFMSITNTQIFSLDVDVSPKPGIEKPADAYVADDLSFTVDAHWFDTQKVIDARNKDKNFTLIRTKLMGGPDLDIDISNTGITVSPETTNDEKLAGFKEDMSETNEALKSIGGPDISDKIEEVENKIAEGLEEKKSSPLTVGGRKIDNESFTDFAINFIRNPSIVNDGFGRYLPRTMFFMMPFTMLIGAMFIRGRGNALLYDHLVHAAYIHAFAFGLIFTGILATRIIPGDLVMKSISVILLIYLPLSLKRMFGRGWFKTIWTSYGVGFIYLISMALILVGITARQLTKEFGV